MCNGMTRHSYAVHRHFAVTLAGATVGNPASLMVLLTAASFTKTPRQKAGRGLICSQKGRKGSKAIQAVVADWFDPLGREDSFQIQ